MKKIIRCPICGNFTDVNICSVCGYSLERERAVEKKKNIKKVASIIGITILVAAILMLILVDRVICIHAWNDATCEEPMTCSKCGKTKGVSLGGHKWANASAIEYKHCTVCGIKDKSEPASIEGYYIYYLPRGNGKYWIFQIDAYNDYFNIYEVGSYYTDKVIGGKLSKSSNNVLNGEGGFTFFLNDDGTLNAGEKWSRLIQVDKSWIDYNTFSGGGIPAPTKSKENTEKARNVTSGEKNALRAANSYLSLMAFSYSGLIDQLKYEGYTQSEAEYAANNCGADWNEEAVKKAKEYINVMAFSKSGLINQLLYEGFTRSQAEYGVEKAY